MTFPVTLRALHERTPTASEDLALRRIRDALAPYDRHVTRVAVRLEPAGRGGRKGDALCVVEVTVDRATSIVAEEHGRGAVEAIDLATTAIGSLLRERFGDAKPRAAKNGVKDKTKGRGSLVGRRVGHSVGDVAVARARPEKKKRDALVDTSAEGTAADDRVIGYGSTASRNTKGKTSGMSYALEDSATGKPSRKSTRGSTNRVKPDSNLRRRETRRVRSPKTRAMKSKARGERATK
jgi:hypothetical protein